MGSCRLFLHARSSITAIPSFTLSLVVVAVDGDWSSWSEWHQCNVTCGGGWQKRNRTCNLPLYGGALCPGSDEDGQECGMNPCPSKPCYFTYLIDDILKIQRFKIRMALLSVLNITLKRRISSVTH